MQTAGLSLEQAPHLSIPAGFFLVVPASLVAAGCLLLFTGAEAFISPWNPPTIALAHIGTIGVLLMGMFGALYQMIPVVAGTPVPAVRLAHGVQIFLLIGLAAFVWRMFGGSAIAMTIASYSLAMALVGFLFPVAYSLSKPATQNETTQGMRVAVITLAAIVVMGLIMARAYRGSAFPESRILWTQIHFSLALLGWVGGLIMSIAWQVVPMFYLSQPASAISKRISLAALVAGLVLPFAAFMAVDSGDGFLSATQWAAVASTPAAVAVWLGQPLLTLKSIAQRKRRRSDASLFFWRAGLISALLLIPLATVALLAADPRWQILFGWFAIWGWAGMIMHGMLTRIVPFLVWFHRIAPLLGKTHVPSIRGLLSQRRISLGFAIHLASIAMGAAAIVTQADVLAHLTGILLAATGASLGSSLYHVLWKSWR